MRPPTGMYRTPRDPGGFPFGYDWRATEARLDNLNDAYRLFRCHTIMNCVDVCPKGLNPSKAINEIKALKVKNRFKQEKSPAK